MAKEKLQSYFYVIMPFGADDRVIIKKEMITKVAEANGFEVHFPRYNKDNEFNLDSTIQIFEMAAFLIADLSLERPSCYYELGLAEAYNREIFLFASTGTDIHQTSFRSTVRFYDNLVHFETLLDELLKEKNKVVHR